MLSLTRRPRNALAVRSDIPQFISAQLPECVFRYLWRDRDPIDGGRKRYTAVRFDGNLVPFAMQRFDHFLCDLKARLASG